VHNAAQVEQLVTALTELWQACPVAKGEYVRLAAE
jgi:5-aminolevulinate synthase